MREEFKQTPVEIISMQEYLNRRKEKRKNKEGEGKVLTNYEWNVMIQSLPPGLRSSVISSIVLSSISSSPLTSIRIAWKVLFAG